MKLNNLILASGSPRRIEMMKQKGYDPLVFPAQVDETLPFPMGMEAAVMYLACKKALWVEAHLSQENKSNSPILIAADTVVYTDHMIGKPSDPRQAAEILSSLRKSSHYVATGVCLLRPDLPVRRLFCEVTKVFFKDFSREALEAYVNTDEPYDKAGGYAIQGTFGKYVDHIEGDYENVIGFPWSRIEKELASL
ncbi:Maf family protein [Anaerovorax odorimutans]|uniref:dTTP/UTP pyrophosphatase n=1 Tax=Anaerovorax odorimutans TaxID=109327 RepID=A0ABT1RRX1_9FIRM|nr:Maf family protein [Anaerovorax odorimutans]MCQ4637941.1 Maf family protein [Anaerovorax odorimutans]